MAARVISTSCGLSSARRILLSGGMNFLFRQREIESGAFVQFSFGPCAAAMARNNATNVCQANASAFELCCVVQPLEHTEKFVCVSHIEPNTVIVNKNHVFFAFFTRANLNFSKITGGAVFDRI